jgi:uroporphyrinogen-III synthase
MNAEPVLANTRIIITRLQKQADIWAAGLHKLGATTAIIPVLALEPVQTAEQIQAVKNIVLDFDLYQKAIFVSQNAVEFALGWLEDYWPQLPQGIEYFAVGETTARSLQAAGLKVSALTAASSGAMNSESLLQAPELQQVQGEKIVIFRGCSGRGKMAEVLTARGAWVSYCELYQRLMPPDAIVQLRTLFADDWQGREIIALHSGESLQHFMQALHAIPRTELDLGRVVQLPVLVPGQRVADLAYAAGFNDVIVAQNATDQAMSAALVQRLKS